MLNKRKLHGLFNFCAHLADLSTCSQTRSGALLVDISYRMIHGIGYSGGSRYDPNDACATLVASKSKKRACRVCMCACAHSNLLANIAASGRAIQPNSAILICTHLPTAPLATALLNTGMLTHVLYFNRASFLDPNADMILNTKALIEKRCPVKSWTEVKAEI